MTLKINVIGSILGTSGYDSHTRSLFNALYKIADVKLSTSLFNDWQKFVNDAELNAITKPFRENDINIIVTTPHNWKLYLGLGINIGYCVWEGDKVPKSYIDEFENPRINMIFVPSEHTKQAIMKTWYEMYDDDAIIEKIKVIPHGVDLSVFYKQNKPKTDNKFRFICNKGWRGTSWDRGGVQYVIKAFSEEFKSNEDVELIIKLNQAYIDPRIIPQVISNLNLPQDRANIKLILNDIPFNKLVDIYNEADCFVCATRCESFNLPGLEAMACGLPTIQTMYGGQIDYMTDKNSLFIDYKLDKVKEDLMYEGISWATPSIEALRKSMRWAFKNQEQINEMGNQALEDSKNWTWDKSAEKIINYIIEYKNQNIYKL